MKRAVHRSAWLLAGILLLGSGTWAQGEAEGEGDYGDYVVAPGDTIQIYIYNEEVQPPPLKVNPKGYIMVRLVGSVKVAGLTLTEVKQLLEQKLARVHKFPEVEVNLVEQGYQRDRIYALGAFEKPGILAHYPGMRVLDVIAAAGGLRADADAAHASLKQGNKTQPLDLERLLKGDLTQNVELFPDDVLDVPRGDFYVIGAVKTPGRFPLVTGIRVMEALSAAGGFAENASLSEAVIFRRDGQSVPLDLWGLLKKGNILNNVPLYSGDILFIPESSLTGGIMVLGEVVQPGLVPYHSGMRLIDALQRSGLRTAAGTPENPAVEPTEVALIRAGEEPQAIDLERLLKKGDLSLNVALQAGDLLVVRRRVNKITLLGRVARPGTYLTPATATLLEVLPQAGGFAEDADLRQVSVLRGSERLVRDIRALVNQGQLEENLDLQDGDIILVPETNASDQVLVVGDVKQPGPHVRRDNETLMQAIAIAGGMLNPGRYEAQITRGEQGVLRADLWSLLREGDRSQNLPVEEGDVIVVRPQEVLVLGWVQRPGRYHLGERADLASALTEAGGPIEKLANLRSVRVIRGDEQIQADMIALQSGGDLTQNLALQANDVVVVPQIGTENGILVLGSVMNPGLHAMTEGEDLLTALALAGGAKVEAGQYAAYPVAQISRGQQTLQADLRRLLELGDLNQNLALQPGDVVFVRSVPEEITIVGQVARPGTYGLRPHARVLDGLGAAGGILERADLRRVVLMRGDQRQIIDVERMLKGRDTQPEDFAQNVALQSGDLLVVPRKENDVLVVGEVNQPGLYPYTEEMRLLQAFGLAKGFLPTADLMQTTIIRGEDRFVFDFNKFLKEGDQSQNVPLQEGDVVLVPSLKEAHILVFGQVEKPGSFPPVEGITLADVLSTASLTPQADSTRISIFRGEELITVDYEAFIKKGDMNQNPPLKRGDRVLVPERERFFLFGAVAQPGLLPVKKDLRIAEIIGFFRPDADLGGVRIIRPNPQGGKPDILRPDLKRFTREADQSQNLAIQAGDFIYVPPKSQKVDWYKNPNVLWQVLSTVNLINRLF